MTGRSRIRIARAMGRVSGFGASVALTTLVSLVALPAIVQAVGATSWASLALIQSVSLFLGTIVAFGWAVTGPSSVASATRAKRARFLAGSLAPRMLVFALVLPVGALALGFLLRGEWGLALLGAVTYLTPSLSAAWYFIGRGGAWRLFILDAVPAAVGTLIGVIVISQTSDLSLYLWCQLLGFVTAAASTTWWAWRDAGAYWRDIRFSSTLETLRSQKHAAFAMVGTAACVAAPVVSVQVWIPAQLPVFAFADRLLRYASIAYSPVQHLLQGWIPAGGNDTSPRRVRGALVVALAFGCAGAAAIALLSGPVAVLLSHGQIDIPMTISGPLGIAFIGVALSVTLGQACLPPLGLTRSIARATLLGLIVCVAASAGSAAVGLLEWVAWSVALAELSVAVYQLAALRRERGRISVADER